MEIGSPTSVASSSSAESPTVSSSMQEIADAPPAAPAAPVAPVAPVAPPAPPMPPPPPPPPAAALVKLPAPAPRKPAKEVKLGDAILKSRPEMKAEFAALDTRAPTSQALTVTNRMRLLDAFRLHMPTPQERNRLAIPDSLERLSIHLAYHVMLLCGGSRGVRFSSSDMMTITSLTSSLNQIFAALERTFGRLSNNARKLLLNAPANKHVRRKSKTQLPVAAAAPAAAAATSQPQDSEKIKEELAAEAARAIEAVNAPELLEELPDIVEFHERADVYAQKIAELQGLARRKHAEIAEQEENEATTEEKKEEVPVIDKDPDAAKGARMPEWLDILMKKYVDEYSKAKFGGIDTIGRFACFLAVCISGDVLITAAESRALQTLIHASEDGQTLGWFAAHPMSEGGGVRLSNFNVELPAKPRKYWSRRFFEFLRKMAELKSIPKGENQLEIFHEFM